MKRQLLSLTCALFLATGLSAQTQNYALSLPTGASVDYGVSPVLNDLSAGTIQFWLYASDWTKGATICSRGEELSRFSVELGGANTVVLRSGQAALEFNDPAFVRSSWVQFSLTFGDGEIKLYVNGKLKNTLAANFHIPASSGSFAMGGNDFVGRLDEFRIWNKVIADPFYLLWRNTVNKWHPQWENLLLYYKFDQDQSRYIVDYKFNNSGAMLSGAARTTVADNELFKYRIASGYNSFGRWCDCLIDADRYLFSNDLVVLGNIDIDPMADKLINYSPTAWGTVVNGEYLEEYEGRSGVLSLKGAGASMTIGEDAFNPIGAYTFSTWLYLDKWTEGAFLFRKEKSETEGFSIRLGNYEDRKRVLIRVNGVEYSFLNSLEVGRWIHLGISTLSELKNTVYLVSVDGVKKTCANRDQNETNFNYRVSGLQKTIAYIGENIEGKFDETTMLSTAKDLPALIDLGTTPLPFPGPKTVVDIHTLRTYDFRYEYDDAQSLGYDKYSLTHFFKLMREHYKGYRGYTIRMGVGGWDGWQNDIADPAIRVRVAKQVAELYKDPMIDGVDVDMEWCEDGTCWNNYALYIDEIRKYVPKGKSLTVTPHYVSYGYPKGKMGNSDYFMFQIYGPGANVFKWNTYVDGANKFEQHGYPKSKIVLSYATTTSVGHYANSPNQEVKPRVNPIGIQRGGVNGTNLTDPPGYTPDMNTVLDSRGYLRYITGLNQVIDRNELIQDRDLGGIFYWDLGNDVPSTHVYSLLKHANYSLASNVDTLITQVDPPLSIHSPQTANDQSELKVNYDRSTGTLTLLNGETLGISSYRLYTLAGEWVDSEIALAPKQLSNLSSGGYVVEATSDRGGVYRAKFLK